MNYKPTRFIVFLLEEQAGPPTEALGAVPHSAEEPLSSPPLPSARRPSPQAAQSAAATGSTAATAMWREGGRASRTVGHRTRAHMSNRRQAHARRGHEGRARPPGLLPLPSARAPQPLKDSGALNVRRAVWRGRWQGAGEGERCQPCAGARLRVSGAGHAGRRGGAELSPAQPRR